MSKNKWKGFLDIINGQSDKLVTYIFAFSIVFVVIIYALVILGITIGKTTIKLHYLKDTKVSTDDSKTYNDEGVVFDQYALENAGTPKYLDYLNNNNSGKIYTVGPPMRGQNVLGEWTANENEYREYTLKSDVTGTRLSIKIDWEKYGKPLSKRNINKVIEKVGGISEEGQKYLDNLDTEYGDCYYDEFFVPEDEKEKIRCGIRIWEAGTVTAPDKIAGSKVYYIGYTVPGMGVFEEVTTAFLSEDLNKFVFLKQGGTGEYDANGLTYNIAAAELFDGYITYNAEEYYDTPEKILIPNTNSHLKYYGQRTSPWDVLAKDNGNDKKVFTDFEAGDVMFDGSSHYTYKSNGNSFNYIFVPPFLSHEDYNEKDFYRAGYVSDIVWSKKGESNAELFQIGGDITYGGCSSGIDSLDSNIVNGKKWFDESYLEEVGKTKYGGGIYEFAEKYRKTSEIYDDLYKFGMTARMYRELDPDFEDISESKKRVLFQEDTPIIFWKDYLGNWRSYYKDTYQTAAECGKPVIYLYPEEITDVRVQVEPNGGLTYVDPAYPEDGWFVRAEPNGTIYNYENDTEYPYLFWEGHADGISVPEEGFVMSNEEVPVQMRDLLVEAGLNSVETEDFMDFWEDYLMVKPYVFVTFVSQREFDIAVPLNVEPKPDYVHRLFMYYEPLDRPKEVEPLRISVPERHGFSVIEWGGGTHHIDIQDAR